LGRKLKVDVYTITYNEGKLLPYFLRHYETFADRIFAWDDGSDDGTVDILKSHPKVTILPHHIGRLDDLYFVRYLWPQYRIYSRGSADWVICAESDEFVYHEDILWKLGELGKRGFYRVFCNGYEMFHNRFPATNGQIYDEARFGLFSEKFSKPIVFSPSCDMKWKPGRHHCSREKKSVRDTGIIILHYRLLGYDFYMDKMRKHYDRVVRYGNHAESLLMIRLNTTEEQFNEWGKDLVQVVW
jgi:glycosyltransferase involved in cell wall biosynthesis